MTGFAMKLMVLAGEKGDMFGGITGFFEGMPAGLKGLGLAIAVVCAIVLGICLMGGGGGAIQKHKGWAISIAVGIMIVCLAPTLVPAIAGAVGGGSK